MIEAVSILLALALFPVGGEPLRGVLEHRLGSRDLRMINAVNALVFDRDDTLWSGGADPYLYRWDPISGKELTRVPWVSDATSSLSLAADDSGDLLAMSSLGVVERISSKDSSSTRQIAHAGPGGVLSPDGQRIAAPSTQQGELLELRDGAGELLRTIDTGGLRTMHVTFSPDSQLLAVASWKGESRAKRIGVLAVVPMDDLSAVRSIDFPEMMITRCLFLDNQRILLCSAEGIVRTYDVGRSLLSEPTHIGGGSIVALAVSPDGLFAACGGRDGKLSVIDAQNAALIFSFQAHAAPISALAFSQDGTRLASGAMDRLIHVWSAQTGDRLDIASGHEAPITTAAWSADSARIITGSGDGTVIFWDAANARMIRRVGGNLGQITAIRTSKSSSLAVIAGQDGSLGWFDPESGTPQKRSLISSMALLDAAWSADGQPVAAVSGDNQLLIVAGDPPSVTHQTALRGGTAAAVAWSASGEVIATGTSIIQLWHADATPLRDLPGPKAPVAALAFTADGRQLISGSADGRLSVWDVEQGVLLRTLPDQSGRVSDFSLSHDGTRIAVCSTTATGARVYDFASGELLASLDGHEDGVNAVAFAPDGRLLTASADATAIVWRLEVNE